MMDLRTSDPFHDGLMTYDAKRDLQDKRKSTVQWIHDAHQHFRKPKLHHQKSVVPIKVSAICVILYSFFESNQNVKL